jgi:hypothetical protein
LPSVAAQNRQPTMSSRTSPEQFEQVGLGVVNSRRPCDPVTDFIQVPSNPSRGAVSVVMIPVAGL